MKHILFLLSGNISTTPRALKTLQSAINQNYSIDLYLINRLDQWKILDDKILTSKSYTINYIPFRKKDGLYIWLFTSLIQKISIFISRFLKNNLNLIAFASSKINILYYLKLKRINKKYDLVIGFSGMYYPAYLYSRRTNTPFAFDMEDYHPGEVIYHRDKLSEINRRIYMLKLILPKAQYVTYASPLIEEKTVNLLVKDNIKPPIGFTINNTFNKSDFQLYKCSDNKVNFVWFSQTISFKRGLEIILPILNKYKNKISLTLIGNLDKVFYEDVLYKYREILLFKGPMPQNILHKEIGKYDIGLAIEQNLDENRSICLTNKIFTYLLSGLYIIASPTKAQIKLIQQFPDNGIIVEPTQDSLNKCINNIINNIKSIRDQKQIRFHKSDYISWEFEEKKLLQIWNKILI